MIPVLFGKTATSYSTNGLGRLECLSCVVTEERNGIYELEASVPVNGNHASEVEMDSIIAVIPSDGGTMQGFRVYQITKPMNGRFIVYARHVSYQLLDIPTMPFSITASSSACSNTLAGLKSHAVDTCPFTFWTNVTTAGSYNQELPAAIRTRLLGTEGSVLDQFGGEYEWDNYTVKLHNKRGSVAEANGITLRYGKNITDLEQEENISNVVTGVVPYWADNEGNMVTLTEKVVYSSYADRYPFKRIEVLDLSTKWEEAPSESTLRTAAQAYVNNSELGVPKVSIKVSFVALWQSEEYKDILPLQRVKLCDEITVIFEKYGISRVAKVVKTVYNVLKERYDSIEVGDLRSSFTSVLNDQQASTMQAIADQSVATRTEINNATKWLTSAGGYVIAIKHTDGTWKELAFSNMTDPYNSQAKVLRVNNNGIGFSTTGLNGTFTNAWTIDGNLVADFIHGGTLTLGGNNNGNGVMSFVDGNNREIIRIDRTGAYFYYWTQEGGVWTKNQIGKWTTGGIDIDKGDINLGSGVFHVTNAGALTATSATVTGNITANTGYIGGNEGFYIDTNILRKGALNSTSDGAVALTATDFSRSVGGSSRSSLRFAIGSNFAVAKDGAVYASSLNLLGGSITIKDGSTTNFSVDSTGSLIAKKGTVGGFKITDKAIHTGSEPASSGNIVLSTEDVTKSINGTNRAVRLALGSRFGVSSGGHLYATDVVLKGSIELTSGSITIQNSQSVTQFEVTNQGQLTAKSGYIGNGTSGWVIGTNNIHNNGGPTAISSTTTSGTYVGVNGLLNSNGTSYTQITGGKLTTNDIKATNGSFTGTITSTDGKIGNFYIGNNIISSGTNTSSTASGSVTLASADFTRFINGGDKTNLRFAIGSKFAVDADGVLYATSGVFKGDITGATGTFSGLVSGGSININNRFTVSNAGRVHITTMGTSASDDYLVIEDPGGKETIIGGEYMWSTGAAEAVKVADLLNYYLAHR